MARVSPQRKLSHTKTLVPVLFVALALGSTGVFYQNAVQLWIQQVGFAQAAGGTNVNDETRAQLARKLFKDGQFREALQLFEDSLSDPKADPIRVSEDLCRAWDCLVRLNLVSRIDSVIEKAVDVHAQNWRLLRTSAQLYLVIPHIGTIIGNEFQRGEDGNRGKPVNCEERDRVRAMQLMVQAIPLVEAEQNRGDAAQFHLDFADIILFGRGWSEAWRLQALTDLSQLPDYEEGWYFSRNVRGAPVDEEGNPIFYFPPRTFDQAKNDGERWRWCLTQAKELNPGLIDHVDYMFAEFLWTQFGVQTLADYGWYFARLEMEGGQAAETGTWALHTLGEDETIAQLATGIKRFKLPDEFNFIRIWKMIADKEGSPRRVDALSQLAQIFENRRQYPKAADYWKKVVSLTYGDQRAAAESRLQQIVGNWGRFEPIGTQPAGQGATVEYRFRNGTEVTLTAYSIKMDQLLADVKDYIKGRPQELDWEKINIENLGYRLIEKAQTRYLGPQVASWKVALEPRPNHFDKRITLATPLQKAGAYLLKAEMKDGNTCFIILWIADAVIAQKPLDNGTWFYVADAVTGEPIPRANVEFFGWQQIWPGSAVRPPQINIQNFAEYTNPEGQIILRAEKDLNNYHWLIIARTKDGRLAFLGFTPLWFGQYYDAQYSATKVFTITDRPVYRPGHKVHYKLWIREAKYDQPDTSAHANESCSLELRSPKGDQLWEKHVKTDEYGGIQGEWEIPQDATLGMYHLIVRAGRLAGGGAFRVEEYKKPEFEVTVQAPEKPVALGETIEATIQAKYYFGSPVTHAKVKYKIERTGYTEAWYPPRPFDWLYGPGYWWFAYEYTWYPGWREWGCPRPRPFWIPWSPEPPELIGEQEVLIGEDGTVKVTIDTAAAKMIHPDQDHRYRITVEVTDQSRRTIVGSGEVLVTRKPFKVYLWLSQGYHRTGDVITVHSSARTPDGRPVEGQGKLSLYKITYKEGKPVENEIRSWDLPTDVEGEARLQIKAAEPGQFRLVHRVTDTEGHTIEGGYVFTIIGENLQAREDFRFNDLELIPDKPEYQPGEKVQLQVNTNRRNGNVLLFVRPANGVYKAPALLRLEGKSTIVPIEVVVKDMPNFFVEAVTVYDGKLFSEVKEIIVPPENRVLNVEVTPSKTEYLPDEKAKVGIKLTDHTGEPFVGSTVVAIYDKSVEYISGGSNVPEIKAFFWKWRRHHDAQTMHSLQRGCGNILPPNKPGMQDLGIFGASVVEEVTESQRGVAYGGGFGNMVREKRGMMLGEPMAVRAALAPMAEGLAMEKQRAAQGVAVDARNGAADRSGGEPPAVVEPTIRKEFADTALWVGALITKADGTAEIELSMPQNLTTWRIKVWAMGHGTKVGEAVSDVVTRKNLILRLQAPRFFVQSDEVVLSANVHNYLKRGKSVQVRLELEGDTLEPLDDLIRTVEIAANDEARVDWRVRVKSDGEALARMAALTDEESDAMEMRFPVYVHGMDKMVAYSGWIRPEKDSLQFKISVPAERRPESARLEVRFSPTLAGAMVDALPYLIDYPYGCTEQTLNRFLPAVITQKVLIDLGLDLEDIRNKRTNLNAQEIGAPEERAKQWRRFRREPVFDKAELDRIVKDGVQRLTEMQLSDGGWGWFSGWGEFSSPHLTAVVVHGLQIAQENDVAIVPDVLSRGVAYLQAYQQKQIQLLKNAESKIKNGPWKSKADNLDAFVYMVLVDANVANEEMKDYLYRDRLDLSVYALAMYGLALHKQQDKEKLDMVLRNISQYVEKDDENQTAWLNLSGWTWWYWYGDQIEAMAYYLKLLARTDAKGELAPRLVKYLLNNRKHATYWNSTRDTALVVEAFADYIRASGEAKPEMTVEVWIDGELKKAVEITPQNLFSFDNMLVVAGEALTSGEHLVELRRKGQGPVYANAYVSYFTLEDFIPAAGLEIKVDRRYYRLVPIEASTQVAGSRGQVVRQRVSKFERQPLDNLAELKSGELVEIELILESKNDYEYLVFEDMKPAGFEPVDLLSGYTRDAPGAYVEFRDNRVVFFCRGLSRGRHSLSYRMRAEIPGKFSALPTRGYGMYAPELRANSDEIKLRVVDDPTLILTPPTK
ncbi:MAG: alpha-2-macroglobulin family protein [Thermogutta sp.]